jgi:hypothetical protein
MSEELKVCPLCGSPILAEKNEKLCPERDALKISLYDLRVELDKTRTHYVNACVQRDSAKEELQQYKDALRAERDLLNKKLKMAMEALEKLPYSKENDIAILREGITLYCHETLAAIGILD